MKTSNLIFFFIGVIFFNAFLIPEVASAIGYETDVLSITEIDYNKTTGTASVVWNGSEYKVAYMNGDGPNFVESGLPQHKIEWATLDKDGNLLKVESLIENPEYSAQNPSLIFTGMDYILMWIEANPNFYFKKLHATIIDEDGNIINDKIITPYVTTWEHPYTYEYGTYSAVWDVEEDTLYVVYAEGDPRLGYGLPHWEKLMFAKLYKTSDSLDFVTWLNGPKLVKGKKLLFPAMTAYNRISMVKTPNNLVIAAGTCYGSPVPFLLLDLKGNILEKNNSIFGFDTHWPTLYLDGESIILGHMYEYFINDNQQKWLYKVSKIDINNNNNGLNKFSVKKNVEIEDINPIKNPVLLRKDNGQLAIVWKDEINGDKAFYTIGLNEKLEIISNQKLDPPYLMGDLSDYYLIGGIGNDVEFALLFTKTYIYKHIYLLRFNFKWNYVFVPIKKVVNIYK